jgi:hypothetical protein
MTTKSIRIRKDHDKIVVMNANGDVVLDIVVSTASTAKNAFLAVRSYTEGAFIERRPLANA